ncbi:MAG: AAA family ATPase [Methanobrevibacter sp.]|nr:AAA family ATPase [Methanobrevibacter sp.]
MGLKFKDKSKIPRKVIFYGKDGCGKSTQATRYVKAKGLHAVCVDVDETNFTDVPILDVDLSNPLKAYTNILTVIEEVSESEDFDTLIIDGITSWIQYMTPKKDPFYQNRNSRFNEVMKELRNSGLNVILIGQVDMYVEDPGKEEKNNKMVVYLNGWVNEKYYCSRDENGKFSCIAEKKREVEA